MGDRTVVVIRVRVEAINGKGEAKEKGFEKRGKKGT